MKKLFYWVAVVAFTVGVIGCSATAPVDETAADSSAPKADNQAEGQGMTRDEGVQEEVMEDEDSLLSRTTIYFDLDSSEVSPDFREVLRAHGNLLAANPESRVTVEGHTDERGSREYNLALGERRAYAVRMLLMLQGAAANQIEIISFGEERPEAFGHNEAAWRLNRRAVLRYPGL